MSYELSMILEKISGKFICVYDGARNEFASGKEFENSDMEKNCTVSTISTENGAIVLELKKWESNTPCADSEWVKEHKRKYGEEPSFF